ncbi:MAG TPA: T9SS type A sorting domain-containing protein [Flavobacterium sp.]|uniref:T9SS type A sorting domain-containing protein n=1 Tax=Flavobacterium sp. TaxID=239 RepID=UPI002B4B3BDC|nr:T9SS type A sorting domain-containing protein [Flavobacterium sp.]HLO73034.1 T9SS type A sorting domain-containing protein [Flavobacterium sp.]
MTKKTFLISKVKMLSLVFLPSLLFSQDILWERSYGGKHAEFLYDAIPTPDYGFLLAGSSISNKNGNKSEANKGDLDYWVWKMDEKGTAEWQKSFGGNGVDLLQSVRITTDGGFILAGTSSSNLSADKKEACKGQEDFWIIKLDAKGGEIWQRTIGGSGQEKLLSIAQTKDGGYILGGTSSSNTSEPDEKGIVDKYGKSEDSRGSLDYWVVKLDPKGEIEWQKTLGGKYVDELKSIEQTLDEGYILGGYSNSPESGDKAQGNYGLGDYWIVKLDKEGNQLWQQTLGGDKDDNLFTLSQTKDGGFILGGNSNSGATNSKSKTNKNGTDFWVLKLDKIGTIEWQETYNYGKLDVLTSIVENQDDTYLIGGYAQSEAKNKGQTVKGIGSKITKEGKDKEGINDYIALKIKATGEEIWTQTVGSKGDEVLKRLFETRDGGYILAGTSKGQISRDKNSNIGGSDFWIVKLKDKDKKEKDKQNIEAIPNPALTYTNAIVGYDYKNGTATLFDLSGRMISTVKINGERTIPIDLTSLPQGIYLIEVKTDVSTDGVKVIKK